MPLTKSINIIDEAQILSRYASDIDNYRRRYSMVEKNYDDDENISIEFVAPKLFLFEEYRFTLLKNSVVKPLQPKMYYRPDYVAYEEYGNINFWAMILFINDIPSIDEFKVDNILVPSISSIRDVIQSASKRKTLEQLVPLYEIKPKATPPLYNKKISIPNNDVSDLPVASFAAANIYFKRETFTLEIVDVRNKYLDLEEAPIIESVNLLLDNGVNYIQDKHYAIVQGTKGRNRLTWNPRLINNGVGLINIMTEGVQCEISYTRKTAK
jgi:hypothetical protein